MFDFITNLGLFVVGCLVLGFIGLAIIAGLIELYDWITGADKRKQEKKAEEKEADE